MTEAFAYFDRLGRIEVRTIGGCRTEVQTAIVLLGDARHLVEDWDDPEEIADAAETVTRGEGRISPVAIFPKDRMN